MSVILNTYSTSLSIQPYLVRVKKNPEAQESIIIDDEVIINMTVSEQEIVWLRVETDCKITVLSEAPSGVSAFTPSHSNFDKTLVLIKAAETFVVEHSGTPLTPDTRSAITGYQQGAMDILYIKIDHTANTITIYS
jgi:hypothetical protein